MHFYRAHKPLVWFLGATTLAIVTVAFLRFQYRERLGDPSEFRYANASPLAEPSPGQLRRLFVIVHEWTGSRATMSDVQSAVEETYPGASVLVPEYPASLLSNENPLAIVSRLMDSIQAADAAGHYDQITLVGYSIGALIVRKALVCAWTGCPGDREINRPAPASWARKVERLVLLAGMNRGWATHCEKSVDVMAAATDPYEDPDCRARLLPWYIRVFMEVGQRILPTLGLGRLALSARRGEPFVANLRLEWLDLERHGDHPLPPVVQLLGSLDDKVSSSDNLDRFVTRNFIFLKLDNTGHGDAATFSGHSGALRRRQFIKAIETLPAQLRSELPSSPVPQDESVRHLVFVMHGIRDFGDWAIPIGKGFEMADQNVRAFYRSYGYFPALYFLQSYQMEANVRWFVDQYTEQLSRYPNAERVSFVGHSNGTYMLANALAQYHSTRFYRVVFAGSVVPRDFPWSDFIDTKRLALIRNYRASDDEVVALLPSVFEYFPNLLNVGSGGFAGFSDGEARRFQAEGFVRGGHSAALQELNRAPMINFILGARDCSVSRAGSSTEDPSCASYAIPASIRVDKPSARADLFYRFCIPIWGVMLLAIGGFVAAVFLLGFRLFGRDSGKLHVKALLPGLIIILFGFLALRYY